jgi:hypothetical protein
MLLTDAQEKNINEQIGSLMRQCLQKCAELNDELQVKLNDLSKSPMYIKFVAIQNNDVR